MLNYKNIANRFNFWGIANEFLTLIYPLHFEDVKYQSGVNHIYEG